MPAPWQVRNVVAECLGRLAAVAPSAVVPRLSDLLASPTAATRGTVEYMFGRAATDPWLAQFEPRVLFEPVDVDRFDAIVRFPAPVSARLPVAQQIVRGYYREPVRKNVAQQ